jgi:hypothetical protein
LIRSAGVDASATYAWTTPMVPPPSPWTIREISSAMTESAKPKIAYAPAVMTSPARIAGRRP